MSSLVSEELRACIGMDLGSQTGDPVSARDIIRVALAWEDPNPVYRDRDEAKRQGFAGLVSPPGALGLWCRPAAEDPFPSQLRQDGRGPHDGSDEAFMHLIPLKRRMAGGGEMEFLAPVIEGDQITRHARLVDVYEKQGREGPLIFTVIESTYVNQRGETVAVGRGTGIYR